MSRSILYIEGNAGASGDMLLAALLDLGFPLKNLKEILQCFPVPLDVKTSFVQKNGIRARSIEPLFPKTKKNHVTLQTLTSLFEQSKLPAKLKEKGKELIQTLARAESKIHDKKPEALSFHELGGWDTVLDLTSVIAALEYFNFDEIWVGPLNVGGGNAKGEHGILPVPAPAVLELLKGFPIYSSGQNEELLTPTGALLLSHYAKPTLAIPPMTLQETGYGAGKKELDFPNVLRAFRGEKSSVSEEDTVLKLETNIDDMNPQFWEHIFERLYEEGAIEVVLSPVIMKKSRPGHLLTILVPPLKEEKFLEILFSETTTLGVRKELISRVILDRKMIDISTPYGKIPCKIGIRNGKTVNISPEYQALKLISKQKKEPLKKIYHSILKQIPSL